MSRLHIAVGEYLALRRSLGFVLTDYDRHLHEFVSFVELHGAVITTDLAIRWAMRQDRSQKWHANLLTEIRGFARYWSATDPRTQVPPGRLIIGAHGRRRPFLYTDEDVRRLMMATSTMRSLSRLWPLTLKTIIGLLAATGMRLGEVLALNEDDIDWEDQILIVRRAKFGKSRLVPVHASTIAALAWYVRQRNAAGSPTVALPLFLSSKGMRLRKSTVYISFRILLGMVGLRNKTAHHGPHLHDFRHRFAVNTLVRAYRAGLDGERRMFVLSTYLGHVDAESTYWYLSAAPELMGEARKRLERSIGRLP